MVEPLLHTINLFMVQEELFKDLISVEKEFINYIKNINVWSSCKRLEGVFKSFFLFFFFLIEKLGE